MNVSESFEMDRKLVWWQPGRQTGDFELDKSLGRIQGGLTNLELAPRRFDSFVFESR